MAEFVRYAGNRCAPNRKQRHSQPDHTRSGENQRSRLATAQPFGAPCDGFEGLRRFPRCEVGRSCGKRYGEHFDPVGVQPEDEDHDADQESCAFDHVRRPASARTAAPKPELSLPGRRSTALEK
jgi:hypothetical protein